jgi:putative transposase
VPHSYVCSYYHCVFSTANRRRLITPDLRDRLWPYLGGIARTNGLTARCVGGTDNHVHMLLSLPSTMAIAKAIQLIKGGSSKWVRDEVPDGKAFEWQEGYGAFGVSASVLPEVLKYIQSQEEHHRVRTFEEEFVVLLEKHGIAYDRRYVFG